ncbi:MAG: ISAs1 family transposase [Caldilineaceae bacterium SB0664_bin_22]|nr:ISAs1 family transposase [Caldilineaceae bacterium SB0664_bin_22]
MEYIVACQDPKLLEVLCAFADRLALLPDPRDRRGVRYPQAVLLGTLLVALAVAAFTRDHRAWFRQWLPLGASVPTDDTYRLWVRRLDPETAMKAALLLLDGTSLPGLAELVLALDGKAARRSGDRADGLRPLHMVSAFLVREGLTLAQEPCDAKSNEITAIPRLLDRIHLEGAVVTIDAAGCQTAIVQALREAGADYVLAVKRNQPTLHREAKAVFDEAERGTFAPQAEDRCETVERNGGRRERRTCTVLGGPGLGEWVADPKTWPDLRSLIRVQAERTGPRGRRQRSVRYYISSRPVDAEALLELVRGHWGIENGLHHTLDVQFREDDCRLRRGHVPAVMAILRRAALNMVKTFQQPFEPDVSMGLLRDRIGRQPWILTPILA